MSLQLRQGEDGQHRGRFAGLETCGSVWACPCCACTVRAERSREVEAAAAWHREQGGELLLLTLTVRHAAGDTLKPAREGVANAWRSLTRGAAWKRAAARLGLVGSVRAVEVTHGRAGWHVHIHALLLVRAGLTAAEIAAERDRLAERWRASVGRTLGPDAVPDWGHGCDLRRAHVARYLSKLALELTAPAGKAGRAVGNRTPLEIAADYARDGSRRDAALWREWVEGMRGCRFLTWSRGLRDQVGLDPERSDEQITADAERAADDMAAATVAIIDRATWRARVRVRGWSLSVLLAAERSDWSALALLLAPVPPVPIPPIGRAPA